VNVGGFRQRLDRAEAELGPGPELGPGRSEAVARSELAELLDVASKEELEELRVPGGRREELFGALRARLERVESGALMRVATRDELLEWRGVRKAIASMPDIEISTASHRLHHLILELDARYLAGVGEGSSEGLLHRTEEAGR
jgi:hypothetical protein